MFSDDNFKFETRLFDFYVVMFHNFTIFAP